MALFSYKIEHDYGLAPNPFGGFCTLAVCRASVRGNKNLKTGDWVIGTGSKRLNNLHRLIYAMKVSETITFNEYWNDKRFQVKKPVMNGSLVSIYGDNFYHKNPITKEWIQEDSAHSFEGGKPNPVHIKKDTKVDRVLISDIFYYFGKKSILIPSEFREVCSEGRDMKGPAIPDELGTSFIKWIKSKFNPGIMGEPSSWSEHKLF